MPSKRSSNKIVARLVKIRRHTKPETGFGVTIVNVIVIFFIGPSIFKLFSGQVIVFKEVIQKVMPVIIVFLLCLYKLKSLLLFFCHLSLNFKTFQNPFFLLLITIF
jgi:hypothetical protein